MMSELPFKNTSDNGQYADTPFLAELPPDFRFLGLAENGKGWRIEHDQEQLVVIDDGYGHGLHGPAASHTGFRSVMNGVETGFDSLYTFIRTRINNFKSYPYLVGPRDAPDCGWKLVRPDYTTGRVQIRLCQWAYPETLEALESLGFECSCPLNCYWLAPVEWDESMVSEVLAPWMASKSRRQCGETLVHQLMRAYQDSDARNAQEQISLF